MTAVLVRKADPSDFGTIRALAAAANEEVRGPMGPTLFSGYIANVLDVDGRAGEAELLVAEVGGTVVGTITFYADANDEGMSARLPDGTAGIRATAVQPDARGMGIGHRLVEACLDRAGGIGARAIALHTAACMTAAIALYERHGFRRDRTYDFRARDFFGGAEGDDLSAMAFIRSLRREAR